MKPFQKIVGRVFWDGALLVLFWRFCTKSAPDSWCTFGAFAPKVHQNCTRQWCTFGAFAPEVHQKCTTFGQTAPKVHHMAKMHQKCIKSGALLVLFHQKCTKSALCTGALLALLHQKSTKTAPVLRRSYWRFGKNWKIFPKKFQKNLTGSENFPRIFRNFSKSPVTPPEHWCSFGALLVQQHHKCTRPSSVLLRQDYRQAGETARHSDPRPRPLQLVEDLFWGVALQLPQQLSALGLSVGPRPRSSVQSLAHSCAP